MIKKFNVKSLLLQVLGIFVARATIGGLSPFAVSFFASMYLDNNKKILTMMGILLGMITVSPEISVIKYLVIMVTIWIVAALMEKSNKSINSLQIGGVSGIITVLINLANKMFSSYTGLVAIEALAEGIAVFAFTLIFRKGIQAFLREGKGTPYNNEEMVSISIILAIAIYGLPKLNGTSLTIPVFVALLLVLIIGYRYGSGYGAIIGVTCGIAISFLSGNYSNIGIFSMLGILAGAFREWGKLASSIAFVIGGLVLLGLGSNRGAIPVGVSGAKDMFSGALTGNILPLISGSVLFLLLPESITYKTYNNKVASNDSFSDQSIQILTKDRLKEFSDSFNNLANSFKSLPTKKTNLKDIDKKKIFNELSEELCWDCGKCDICWNEYSTESYEGLNHIIDLVEEEGTIKKNQIPEPFRERCIKLDACIAETRRMFDLEKLNISCNNKLLESRQAIAEQFSQIAFILEDFSSSIYKSSPSTKEIEKKIVDGLRPNYIFVSNVAVFEKRNNRKEIFIYAHTLGEHCITTKETSQLISKILNKEMIPSEKSKTVITKTTDIYIFEEDSNYNVFTGVSKMKKDGSLVSGDNYSFIRPDSGTAVMTLSDGMGTGEEAYKESEAVIDLLEQFIEAGFNKESAIKLINSVMLIRSSGSQTYSTVDMSVINLYTGMCDFIKLGASTTFIKSTDNVEIIQSSALPLGIINQVDYEVYTKKLKDGDFVIMVTDGLIDSIPGDDKEGLMSEFIGKINMNNPKEVANAVLNFALECNGWLPKDDMTVIVGGFWKKK